MPVAGQRDPEETRLKLVNWLARQMPEARDVAVPELTIPQSSGFSNETFLFDATWTDADGSQRAELVLRAQPQEYGLFPNIDVLSQQDRTLALLHEHTDVPVPRVRWPEPDAAVLGQPFFVMDRVRGDVPGDAPPYTTSGFLVDLPPEGRRALHEDALDVMTRIHRVDWRSIGFDHLDRKQFGPLGSGQLRGFFEHYYGWVLDGRPHKLLDAAWRWLGERWPRDDEHIELTWGDARIGNQMFREERCVAVFDWEMAALTNAESDLGLWIFMQRFHSESIGAALPEGLLDRAETVAFWEERLGRRASHVDFYEVLGGFYFVLIMMMLIRNMQRLAPGQAESPLLETLPGSNVLARLIGVE